VGVKEKDAVEYGGLDYLVVQGIMNRTRICKTGLYKLWPFASRLEPSDIFMPALDFQSLKWSLMNGFHKPFGKLQIGDQGDIQVNGLSPDEVIIIEFFFFNILGDIDYQVYFSI